MPWQGIGGAIADGAFDFLNTTFSGLMGYATDKKLMKKQFEYQKELQKIQNDYNVYNYQHQNQWRVDDLRAAGLNPILSATSGTSVAPASAGAVGLATSKFHPSNSDRFLRLAMQSAELNSARAKSEVAANEASAVKSLAEAKATTSMANQNAKKFEIMEPAIRKQAEYESSTSHQWSRHVNDWTQALSPVLDLVPGTVLMHGARNFFGKFGNSAKSGPFSDREIGKKVSYDPERKVFYHKGD
jgi:hypothetical protein